MLNHYASPGNKLVDKARAYLVSKRFDLTGYMVGTQLDDTIPGHEEIQYIFEQIGYAKTKNSCVR